MGKLLCEVNGIVVLRRRNDGTVEAPLGLEGVASYFEAEGIPEKVVGYEGITVDRCECPHDDAYNCARILDERGTVG